MLKRLLRAMVGVVLLPIVAGVSWALFGQLRGPYSAHPDETFFLMGAAGYCFCHLVFHRPILAYVLAHESTHVLWTWLFGGKVKRFKVSSRGGHVKVTRANVLVTLAPYFFPLYALLALAGYAAAVALAPESRVRSIMVALVGAAWAFHALLTLGTLRLRQPDIVKTGRGFSYVFIYVLNVLILVALLGVVSDHVSMAGFAQDAVHCTRLTLARVAQWASAAHRLLARTP